MLKRLAALLALVCACSTLAFAASRPRFVRVNELYVLAPGYPASMGDVFVNTYSGLLRPAGCKPDTWCSVDVAAITAEDAVAVFLSGLVVVTHGTTVETADVQFAFRAGGDVPQCPAEIIGKGCGWYNGQSVETAVGGGQRSGYATWVPVQNGRIEFLYHVTTPGTWPDNSSYGLNLTIQAYAR